MSTEQAVVEIYHFCLLLSHSLSLVILQNSVSRTCNIAIALLLLSSALIFDVWFVYTKFKKIITNERNSFIGPKIRNIFFVFISYSNYNHFHYSISVLFLIHFFTLSSTNTHLPIFSLFCDVWWIEKNKNKIVLYEKTNKKKTILYIVVWLCLVVSKQKRSDLCFPDVGVVWYHDVMSLRPAIVWHGQRHVKCMSHLAIMWLIRRLNHCPPTLLAFEKSTCIHTLNSRHKLIALTFPFWRLRGPCI